MKTTAFNWKYLKYLFWLGPVLTIMGLTAGLVAGTWGVVPLGLILAGVAVMAVWLISEGNALQGFLGQRSTQAGTNAIVSSLAVLVILGLLNFLAVRYVTRVDLTENQLYSLAPQSQTVAQELQQPAKIWIFDLAENPDDLELLNNYRRQTDNFSYEYVNPRSQPGIVREFGMQTVGDVYLEVNGQRRLLQTISDQERLSERRLTNGLAQLTNDRQTKIYFLQGHGERSLQAGEGGLSEVQSRTEEERYTAEPLNLAEQTTVPEDAAVLIVAGPQRELLETEVTALKDYLKRRSGLMLLIDPQTNPKLESLLNDWGVALSDRIIVDPAGQSTEALVTFITQYGDHPITRAFGNGISFYPIARPIELKSASDAQTTPLLFTNSRTEARRIGSTGQLEFDPATDPRGPFVIGAALSRPATELESQASPSPSPNASPEPGTSPAPSPSPSPDESTTAEARLVVIGNSSFISDGLFSQQLNGDVFLNAVNWLSQQDDQVLSIRPKEMTNRRILMQPWQQILALVIPVIFLPLAGFGMGLAVWWKRR